MTGNEHCEIQGEIQGEIAEIKAEIAYKRASMSFFFCPLPDYLSLTPLRASIGSTRLSLTLTLGCSRVRRTLDPRLGLGYPRTYFQPGVVLLRCSDSRVVTVRSHTLDGYRFLMKHYHKGATVCTANSGLWPSFASVPCTADTTSHRER
jgi:hypothetical protein